MLNIKDRLPSTTHRVAIHTNPEVNYRIRNESILNLSIYKNCTEEEITERLKMLRFEWDTERVLEANASSLVLVSSILGLKFSKCWFWVTGSVSLFLLWHALTGWCPPVPIIRRMGVRTAEEINNERIVLKMIRKDFKNKPNNIADMLKVAEK